MPHRKARRKLHEAEQKRLAELEEERRHRLGQGKDVSDLEMIIADRSLDTGGDVKLLTLEGQPLLTNGVAEGAIVPHQQTEEAAVNEDPVKACVEIKHAIDATCLRSCICAMAWRFHAIDATWSCRLDGVEAHTT